MSKMIEFETHDNYRRHRAVKISDNEPVTGFLWKGSDHAYIIPHNAGISYTLNKEKLEAPAFEVYPETIAVDSLLQSDDMVDLFEGDRISVRGQEFVLDLMDPDVLAAIFPDSGVLTSIKLVRKNYEDFVEKISKK